MTLTRFLLLFCTLIFSSAVSAQVVITDINDAYSRKTGKLAGDTTTTITTLFGGLSGAVGDCSTTNSGSLCNNCVGTSACNSRRIHDNLALRITFTYPAGDPGPVLATNDIDSGNADFEELDFFAKPSGDIISGTSTVTVEIQWKEICNVLFQSTLDGGCEGTMDISSEKILRVGIASNNDSKFSEVNHYSSELRISMARIGAGTTPLCKSSDGGTIDGVCNFIAYPGDSKVFIENVRTGNSFPSISSSDADIQSLRVFHVTKDSNDTPTQATTTFTDLTIGSTNNDTSGAATKEIELSQNEVGGLENGTTYRFAIGALDEANNLGLVTNVSSSNDPDNNNLCFSPSTSWNQNCHYATPGEVIGLIEDEFDCFITTATYGSPFRPKVKVFRTFRNQFLKTNWLGRKIISAYYKTSPPIARWIQSNPEVKPFMRALLWPLWLFAKVCLEYPLFIILGLISILLVLTRKTYLKGAL